VGRGEQPIDHLRKGFRRSSATKALTSSGVGGKPIRSYVARRMSVRFSASAVGSELRLLNPREDKVIDFIGWPFSELYWRRLW
jgi:hypothetical protein